MNAIEIPGWSFSGSDMAEAREKFNRPGGTAGKSLAGGLVLRRTARRGIGFAASISPNAECTGLGRQPAVLGSRIEPDAESGARFTVD